MASRLKIIGVILIIIGIIAWGAAAYAYTRVQSGADALEGYSAAQDVQLSYNEDGELVDRGTTEGAEEIKKLLGETWGWPIDEGELNPDDPVINTATEYMFQMATIAQHTLHGTQTVVLPERVAWPSEEEITAESPTYGPGEWDGTVEGYGPAVFLPGAYQVPVAERYWTGFNRVHPLDGPARGQAWSGTVHGLFAELGVGATTATSLQMAMGVVGVTVLMGLGFVVVGGGLVWVGYGAPKKEESEAEASA